uniref:Similarity n=1 Tax=Microcystis aeruginosa (strain PCC 7806) TaxID=267872 RepID=A8YIZ3_MICA7|nr:unnamed protein product [Microcystis aeruginosa PCC 7806]
MGGLRRIINLLVNSLNYRRLTHPTHGPTTQLDAALELKLSVCMYFFCQLNSDGDKLVEV